MTYRALREAGMMRWIVGVIAAVAWWTAAAAQPAEDTAQSAPAVQQAVEAEQARQELGVVTNAGGETVVFGVVGTDTFLNVSPAMRRMLTMSGGGDALVKASERFSLYLRGYLASSAGTKLAEIDEARLADLRSEIEAGQLGARDKEQQAQWSGIDGFVSGRYGYGKVKGLGFVPLKHARLSLTAPDGKKRTELLALAPYSTAGSSDPAMALQAARDLRDLAAATPEQQQLADHIAIASQRYQYLRHAGFLLPLLAGAEYIVAGILASKWERTAEDVGDNPNGYTITKYACYVLGGFSVVASPVNPIMAAIYKHKQKRLKREYNQKYGERYALN